MSLNTEHLSPCRNVLEKSSNNYRITLEYVFLKLLTESNTTITNSSCLGISKLQDKTGDQKIKECIYIVRREPN